jgi:hypothetical protein
VHALDPFVLSGTDKDLKVVIYKQIRKNARTVIELLHHYVYTELPGGEVVLSFKPLDEEALKETDRVAFDDLHERRKGVMRNNFSIVSGKEIGCLVLTPDAIGCSRVQMVIRAEYDVELDDDRRTFLLWQIVAPLYAALEACKRCDWVDDMERAHFINVTIPTAPDATADELAMIDKALTYNVDDSQFQRVRGSLKRYPTISMFVGAGSSDKLVWGKGYGDVDAALEEVFAYAWKSCSYERMAVHRRKPKARRSSSGDRLRRREKKPNRLNRAKDCADLREQVVQDEIYVDKVRLRGHSGGLRADKYWRQRMAVYSGIGRRKALWPLLVPSGLGPYHNVHHRTIGRLGPRSAEVVCGGFSSSRVLFITSGAGEV